VYIPNASKNPFDNMKFQVLQCIFNPYKSLHNYKLYMFPKMDVICYSGCSVCCLNIFTNTDIPKY